MKSIRKDHDPPSNSSTTVGDTGQQDVHQGRQELIRCLQYFVNLVLILQAVFQNSFEFKQRVASDIVNEIVYKLVCSEREGSIHNEITTLAGDQHGNQNLLTSNSMVDRIRSLIEGNEIKNDDLIIQTEPPLPSLLAILRIASSPRNAINRITLGFMSKLLDSQDYLNVISETVAWGIMALWTRTIRPRRS
ncbi:hypothetical protein F5887DRAFT_3329 [Amanita rubescens]|nr:hypothetical protein F5887DRAFT_3329 [Amanita rubescens]